MKIKDIAKTRPWINCDELETFLYQSEKYHPLLKSSMFGRELDDSVDIEMVLDDFASCKQAEIDSIVKEDREKEEKRIELASMLISSGYSFEGYRIIKYAGLVSGDDAIQVDRGKPGIFSDPTNVGDALMNSLSRIRQCALAELKEAAYKLGCNAVIGIDFDYITMEPETVNSMGGKLYLPYVIGVTANGNAVVVEKINE